MITSYWASEGTPAMIPSSSSYALCARLKAGLRPRSSEATSVRWLRQSRGYENRSRFASV
jgi:hypothetical protein